MRQRCHRRLRARPPRAAQTTKGGPDHQGRARPPRGGAMTSEADAPILELSGIVKSFGTVRALRGADLTVRRNEIVALVGDNGAGKSTMIKVISGVLQP